MRLRDKVAIVTGAGAGIGEATAVRLAEEGAKVVLADIGEASATAAATKVARSGFDKFGFMAFIVISVFSS